MREQKGYIFHKGKSWFVRYCDDVLQTDGAIKRKLVCKKLDVEYGRAFRTKASVKPFAAEVLAPVNKGTLNVQSTMLVAEFVEKKYLPNLAERGIRASTRKQYGDTWKDHVKGRMGALRLRNFRTVHGEQMLSDIARQTKLGRHSLKHIKSLVSGIFKEAKRRGFLDDINPIKDVSIPRAAEEEETYAYSLAEIKAMLAVLNDRPGHPAWTVVLTAALTGLRKGEIRGIAWDDFAGNALNITRSVWGTKKLAQRLNPSSSVWVGVEYEPKTKRTKAPIPVRNTI